MSLGFMIGVVVLGAIWYVVAWRCQRAARASTWRLAYREIPPE